MRVGLPILANTAAFAAVVNVDRVLILAFVSDGVRAVGLYSVAILGTSWSLDLAGRLVVVLYASLQTTLGQTGDAAAVARQAAAATEAQAPLLAAGAAVAAVAGPPVLGALLPRYLEGLPALRPLLPGTVLLGLTWPARQALITVSRPYRLCVATLAGLGFTALAGAWAAGRGGTVGVAWAMSLGYATVFLLTSATALLPALGWQGWLLHLARLLRGLCGFAAGAWLACHIPISTATPRVTLAAQALVLVVAMLPALIAWGRRHRWGGLWD
jgi:O-antigen/teichoic acid export membrane protein